jgi:hypothetical protein
MLFLSILLLLTIVLILLLEQIHWVLLLRHAVLLLLDLLPIHFVPREKILRSIVE